MVVTQHEGRASKEEEPVSFRGLKEIYLSFQRTHLSED